MISYECSGRIGKVTLSLSHLALSTALCAWSSHKATVVTEYDDDES